MRLISWNYSNTGPIWYNWICMVLYTKSYRSGSIVRFVWNRQSSPPSQRHSKSTHRVYTCCQLEKFIKPFHFFQAAHGSLEIHTIASPESHPLYHLFFYNWIISGILEWLTVSLNNLLQWKGWWFSCLLIDMRVKIIQPVSNLLFWLNRMRIKIVCVMFFT
jgi:hypothetical protein